MAVGEVQLELPAHVMIELCDIGPSCLAESQNYSKERAKSLAFCSRDSKYERYLLLEYRCSIRENSCYSDTLTKLYKIPPRSRGGDRCRFLACTIVRDDRGHVRLGGEPQYSICDKKTNYSRLQEFFEQHMLQLQAMHDSYAAEVPSSCPRRSC